MSGENDVTPVARAEFLRLLDQQEAKGVETYGRTLQAGNGRDALQDAAEELVDAFKYLQQARMENAQLQADLAAAREREQRLMTVIEDAVQVGEMQGEDFRLMPWSTLSAAIAAAAPSAVAQEPRGKGV